jgi:hypothetical protein
MSLDQLFSVNMETKTIEEQKITIDNFNYLFKNGKYKNGVFYYHLCQVPMSHHIKNEIRNYN